MTTQTRPTHRGARPSQSERGFSTQKGFTTDRNTPQFHQLSGWLLPYDPASEEAGCGGPGLAWLHVVCGCEAVLPNSLKRCWRQLMVEKLTFNYLATALVDIPAVSMPIARSL